jgi:hypothetical protein
MVKVIARMADLCIVGSNCLLFLLLLKVIKNGVFKSLIYL